MGNLVSNLTGGRIPPHYRAHIDPDLVADSLPRLANWRPIFGQTGQAQSHLRKNNIGSGDIFLFFGLFRRIEIQNGSHTWMCESRPCHVIWGWLQVGKVLNLGNAKPQGYEWAEYHPHFNRTHDPNNVVYIARRQLKIDGKDSNLPGAGIFSQFHDSLQLTAPRAKKVSLWELPRSFFPENRSPLTYHSDIRRWHDIGDRVELQSVARGQEFVLDCNEYPEASQWVLELIKNHNKC